MGLPFNFSTAEPSWRVRSFCRVPEMLDHQYLAEFRKLWYRSHLYIAQFCAILPQFTRTVQIFWQVAQELEGFTYIAETFG